MRQTTFCAIVLGLMLLCPGRAGLAQEPAPPATVAVNVFLDCNTFFCDFDHFRREIGYVNWVRNREDADVHLLITSRTTGGGGWEFTLAFLGRGDFAERENTLHHFSNRDDTTEEVRGGLTRIIELGLVGYVADTPSGENLSLSYQVPSAAEAAAAAAPEDDPWNFWTFTVRVSGSTNGERQQRFLSGNGSVSANRTTEAFKISFSVNGSHNRSEFDVVDTAAGLDTTYLSTRTSYGFHQRAVWSLGPHWSAGFATSVNSSTFLNQDLSVSGGPAIEYNVYPYDESTRRQLTFMYTAGPAVFDYAQLTVFDKTSEVRPSHELSIGLDVQQPWGSIYTSVSGSQFLDNLAQHQANVFGSVNFRVVRGLRLNLFGSIARIKDQIYLAQEGLTAEEILLRQRQLGTDFRYRINLGLTYQFGSKFNNVVNPRMGGGGGQVIFF